MAESERKLCHVQENKGDMETEMETALNANCSAEDREDSPSCPGALLADKQTFESRSGHAFTASPVIVDFRRLLQVSSNLEGTGAGDLSILHGVSNHDLLHAVVGLYDVSLSEMTPDVLYATVAERWARTIILVRDLKETLEDLKERKKAKKDKAKDGHDGESDEEESRSEKGNIDGEEKDVYEEDEAVPSKFELVYSDTESEEEEEEEEEEEDYSKGINRFIEAAKSRRKNRLSTNTPLKNEHVGIENRIVGCLTFEKKYVKHKDRVIHLTLLTTRKRFRKYGVGKYLLSQLLDPAVVGQYEAVVVHADNAAIDFFQKFGFSDDVVLNSRWSELAEQFTNCTLMCYLPGFSGHTMLSTLKIPGLEVYELEQEFNKWKEKTIEAYQAQVCCMMRFKHEIVQLKTMTEKQDSLIESLIQENERTKKERFSIEKEFLDYRLSTAKAAFETNDHAESGQEADICTDQLISDLQRQVDLMGLAVKKKKQTDTSDSSPDRESNYVSFPSAKVRSQQEPYDHMKDAAFFYNVAEQFKQGMKMDKSISQSFEVTTISKALVPEKYQEKFKTKRKCLRDQAMVTELYFCGTLERPERIQEILKHGFSEADFSHGEYGRGLYFSKYPSKAGQFSALGRLLLAEVAIGATETVTKVDRTRKSPSKGCDSIITPGRLSRQGIKAEEASMLQEYVVFDVTQALPLCHITYEESKQ